MLKLNGNFNRFPIFDELLYSIQLLLDANYMFKYKFHPQGHRIIYADRLLWPVSVHKW